MRYQYIPIDRIFTKLGRDVTQSFDEDDVIEWSGEALEFIGAVKYYEEAVAFIEIRNHQGRLPRMLHNIIQVARNNQWTNVNRCVTPKTIVSNCSTDIPNLVYSPCKPDDCQSNQQDGGYIVLDCQGKPLVEYDVAYYRPYFDLRMDYGLWVGSNFYKSAYSPVRLANSSFFNTVVARERGTGLYNNCKDEYTIIQGNIIRTSFNTGSIALAYTRQVRDTTTGYPLIPDNISYTTAIVKYIAMMKQYRDMLNHVQGAIDLYRITQKDWDWYCKQASNVDMMLTGIDEHQNFLDQRQYQIPRLNCFNNYFGNLATPEARPWNNRFNAGSPFRGEGVRVAGNGGDEIVIANNNEIVQDNWDSIEW